MIKKFFADIIFYIQVLYASIFYKKQLSAELEALCEKSIIEMEQNIKWMESTFKTYDKKIVDSVIDKINNEFGSWRVSYFYEIDQDVLRYEDSKIFTPRAFQFHFEQKLGEVLREYSKN